MQILFPYRIISDFYNSTELHNIHIKIKLRMHVDFGYINDKLIIYIYTYIFSLFILVLTSVVDLPHQT